MVSISSRSSAPSRVRLVCEQLINESIAHNWVQWRDMFVEERGLLVCFFAPMC